MTVPFWKRVSGYWVLVGTRPAHRKPNPPSPPVRHTAPTRKPGVGLTGKTKRLHRLMVATAGNPYHWTYNLVRPLTLPKTRVPEIAWKTNKTLAVALERRIEGYRSDCSWGAKTLFWLVGCADDPTGQKWSGYGNSSSIYAHLSKRFGLNNSYHPSPADLARCKVGDIGVVGVNGKDHVWVVMEAGENPLVWSDGHQGAPNTYRVLDDARRPISVCIPKGLG